MRGWKAATWITEPGLCDNVIGDIPSPSEILPMSRAMVEELGIYANKPAGGKEEAAHEDPGPV